MINYFILDQWFRSQGRFIFVYYLELLQFRSQGRFIFVYYLELLQASSVAGKIVQAILATGIMRSISMKPF